MSIISTIMPIVIAILIFCLIIIIHEIGHFSAARLFKMRVYEFSLGIGPAILKKRGKETVYNIKAIPFGGSVQLGEDTEPSDDPSDFRNKPVWQRMIVILAGAFMNIVLGFVLCIIIISMNNKIDTTTIGGFWSEALSREYLQVGDEITHINGMRIFTSSDIDYQLFNTQSNMTEDADRALFDFRVIRNGEKLRIDDVPFTAQTLETGGKKIVMEFGVEWIDKTFFNVFPRAAKETLSYSRLILITLADLVRGTYGLNDISGPVGTVNVIGEATSAGFAQSFSLGIRMALVLAAFISINVGIFNLLPVPALDGARFVFFVIEAVRRKPIKAEVEGMIHFVGFSALMAFMLLITVLDIRKLFPG